MKLIRQKYLGFILIAVAVLSPVIIFLYEAKKMAGIRDLFDVEDDEF
jgi:hypothetical protein